MLDDVDQVFDDDADHELDVASVLAEALVLVDKVSVCEVDNVSDNDLACGLAEVVTDAEFVGETVAEEVSDAERSTEGELDGARELDIVISSVGDF